MATRLQGPRYQCLDQTALADTDLTLHERDRATPSPSLVERGLQAAQLSLSPDQRDPHAHAVGGRRHGTDRRNWRFGCIRGRLEKLAIELFGLGLWLRREVSFEDADAGLVLAKRGAATALLGVEAHQRSVHGLLRGIQPEYPDCGLRGLVGCAGSRLLR